jgi:hypothetical protein
MEPRGELTVKDDGYPLVVEGSTYATFRHGYSARYGIHTLHQVSLLNWTRFHTGKHYWLHRYFPRRLEDIHHL